MKTQLDMKDINNIKKVGVNVISLFSGCGGSSIGYKLAGCSVLLANEFIPKAAEVYRLNHPGTIVIQDDIRKLTGIQLLDTVGLKKYELDILDGSPPCASFSTMGEKQKLWGKKKKYSDTTQVVDDLFFEYVRMIDEIQPKIFVAENVAGLLTGSCHSMLGSDICLFDNDSILSKLKKCGYRVKFKLLDAQFYAVPQIRKRLFIIGVRNDLNMDPVFPMPLGTKITTRMAIEDLIDCGTDHTNSPKRTHDMIKYFHAGTTQTDLPHIIQRNNLKGIFIHTFKRDRWDLPYYTIIQGGDRPFHPKVDRPLSINEGKRIQTFPDDFILPHDSARNWERIGRAVPPNLMKAIAKTLIKNILGVNDANKQTSITNSIKPCYRRLVKTK